MSRFVERRDVKYILESLWKPESYLLINYVFLLYAWLFIIFLVHFSFNILTFFFGFWNVCHNVDPFRRVCIDKRQFVTTWRWIMLVISVVLNNRWAGLIVVSDLTPEDKGSNPTQDRLLSVYNLCSCIQKYKYMWPIRLVIYYCKILVFIEAFFQVKIRECTYPCGKCSDFFHKKTFKEF